MRTEAEIRARLNTDAHFTDIEPPFLKGFVSGFEKSVLRWVLGEDSVTPVRELSCARTREEGSDGST